MPRSNRLARGLAWALTLLAGVGAWALGEPGTPPPTHLADFQHTDRPENQWSAGLRVTDPGGRAALELPLRTGVSATSGAWPVQGGTRYLLSALARAQTPKGAARRLTLQVQEFREDGTSSAPPPTQVLRWEAGPEWGPAALHFQTLPLTRRVRIVFVPAADDGPDTGTARLAEVMLQPGFHPAILHSADFRSTAPGAPWSAPGTRVVGADGIPALEVRDTTTTAYTASLAPDWWVPPATRLVLSGWARTLAQPTHQDRPALFIYEYDRPGGRVLATRTLFFDGRPDWNCKYLDFTTSPGTRTLRVRFLPCAGDGVGRTGGAQLAEVRLTRPPTVLRDALGRPIAGISEIVDLAEQMPASSFWSMVAVPTTPYRRPAAWNLWADPELRDRWLGQIPSVRSLANAARALPIRGEREVLGTQLDAEHPWRVAEDMPHRPFLRAHPGHSTRYYPRRMGDLAGSFREAFALTGDPAYQARQRDMLDFLCYSQYREDGSNRFTRDHCSASYRPEARWRGSFDYLFDWVWKDGYGYSWSLHEGDHHVSSLMAAELVRGYEQLPEPRPDQKAERLPGPAEGRSQYLAAARNLVLHQVPRYGFHTGLWQGQRYYWTEYNPSGGANPSQDATSNVVAAVAEAVAMVGYHDQDPRLLAYAQGLLCYLAREIHTSGWFYYEGAENPMCERRKVSHDQVILDSAFRALVYLRRAGVPEAGLGGHFRKVLETYATTGKRPQSTEEKVTPLLHHLSHPQIWKTFSAMPQVGQPVTVTEYVWLPATGGPDPGGLVFRDPIFNVLGADAEDGGKSIELRVAELVPGEDAARPLEIRGERRVRVDTGWAKGLLDGFGPGATPPRGGRMFRIRFAWTPPTAEALAVRDPEAKTERKAVGVGFAAPVLGLWAEGKEGKAFQLQSRSQVWAHRTVTGELAITGGDADREGTFFSFPLQLIAPPAAAAPAE